MCTPHSSGVFNALCAVAAVLGIINVRTFAADEPQFVYPRIMLCIDASGSMCNHYGPDRCCVLGDSSGFCSKNDPENLRIEASHRFVDSLRARLPGSEAGVVTFASSVSSILSPVSLNSDANVTAVHDAIERAACTAATSVPLGKTAGTATTYIGNALEKAFVELDKNYTASPLTTRHVILLTDGAWDDMQTRSPETLVNAYTTNYPDRKVPYVHAIFIADSITHVQHGYPWQGCADDAIIDLSGLLTIATLTEGAFFAGSTPQTIVDVFMNLLPPVTGISKFSRDESRRTTVGISVWPVSRTGSRFDLSGREVRFTGNAAGVRTEKTVSGVFVGKGGSGNLCPVVILPP